MPYGDAESYRDDEKALKLVFDAQEKSEKGLEPLFEDKWRRNELLYWSKQDPAMWQNAMGATQWQNGSPYDSSVFIPTVLQQVETRVPRLALSLLANDPMWRAMPLLRDGEMGAQARAWMEAEAKERLLHNQCVRDVRIRRRLAPWLRGACLHGTKILSLDWITRNGPDWGMVEKTRKTSEGITTGTGVWEFTKGKGVKLEDRLRVTGRSLWDVFPDPRGQTFRGEDGRVCRYAVTRTIMDVDDFIGWIKATPSKNWWFKRTKTGGKRAKMPADSVWIKELKKLQGQVKGEHNKTACIMAEVGRLAGGQGEGFKATEEDEKLLQVLDYWEPAGGYHILTVGTKDNGLCALREPNPFKLLGLPLITVRPIPLDNQLYGLGIVDMIEHLVYLVNALTNLHLTGAIREANPLVLVDSMSGLSVDELMAQPYMMHQVNSSGVALKECLAVIPFPATGAVAYQEREFALTQLESSAGSTQFTMSGDPGKNVTARGIGQFVQQNALRFNLEEMATGECMCELGEGMDLLNRQFVTGPRLERFTDGKGQRRFTTITPEMIKRPVELEFDARAEAANPELRSQQVLQWASIFANYPNYDMDEAIVETGKRLDIPQPRRFLRRQFNRAEMENEMFRQSVEQGQPYIGEVLPNDPHDEHIQMHEQPFLDGTVEAGGEAAKRVLVAHIVRHFQFRTPGAGGGVGVEQGGAQEQSQEQPQGQPPPQEAPAGV